MHQGRRSGILTSSPHRTILRTHFHVFSLICSYSTWSEWQNFSSDSIHHLASATPRGLAAVKNNAIQALPKLFTRSILDKTMILFTPIAIAAPSYLLPLGYSLDRYKSSLVYPTTDILHLASQNEIEILPSDAYLVSAFDWQFRLTWEAAKGNPRVKQGAASANELELLSPNVPSIFAALYPTMLAYHHFDTTLHTHSDIYSYENTEFALRVWLCGGVVLKQTCSHLAIAFPNLLEGARIGLMTNQRHIDTNVMNIAQKWLQTPIFPAISSHDMMMVNTYKELVFQSRFLYRVPYAVETLIDPITIGPLQAKKGLTCSDFKWFLREIYPGLQLDIPSLVDEFAKYIRSDYLEVLLKPTIDNYNTAKGLEIHPEEVSSLALREELFYHHSQHTLHIDSSKVPPSYFGKETYHEPPPSTKKDRLEDSLAEHSELVRSELVCEDFNYQNYCRDQINLDAIRKQGKHQNIREFCDNNKVTYVFACPKTCGYCEKNVFCEDLYLKKCKSCSRSLARSLVGWLTPLAPGRLSCAW